MEETNTVVEYCSNCETEVEMAWDTEKQGYKAFCPVCGKRLMLCDECQHDNPDTPCDFNSKTGACRRNPEDAREVSAERDGVVYVLFDCDAWKSTNSMRFTGVFDSMETLKDAIAARIADAYYEFDDPDMSDEEQRDAFLAAWAEAETPDPQWQVLGRVKYCHIVVADMNSADN